MRVLLDLVRSTDAVVTHFPSCSPLLSQLDSEACTGFFFELIPRQFFTILRQKHKFIDFGDLYLTKLRSKSTGFSIVTCFQPSVNILSNGSIHGTNGVGSTNSYSSP